VVGKGRQDETTQGSRSQCVTVGDASHHLPDVAWGVSRSRSRSQSQASFFHQIPRRQTTIRLTESLSGELNRKADEQGITRSEHIRQRLSESDEATGKDTESGEIDGTTNLSLNLLLSVATSREARESPHSEGMRVRVRTHELS
jgi:hypothetical protein